LVVAPEHLDGFPSCPAVKKTSRFQLLSGIVVAYMPNDGTDIEAL